MSQLGGARLFSTFTGQRATRTTLVGVVVAAVTLVGFGTGYRTTRALTNSDTAWLRKGDTVVQINGPSARFEAVAYDQPQGVARSGSDPLEVVQEPNGQVFTADPVTHKIFKIDLESMTPVAGPDGTAVLASGNTAYIVNRTAGTVTVINPRTMRPGRVFKIPGPIASQAIAPDGTAYIGETDGRVTVVTPTRAHTIRVAGRHSVLEVNVTGTQPVAIDVTAGKLYLLNKAGKPTGSYSIPGARGAPVRVQPSLSGSSVWLVRGNNLVGVNLSDGHADATTLPSGHTFGAPVVNAGRVYVPDNSAGHVLVFAASGLRPLPPISVPRGAPGVTNIETVTRNQQVWIDNPSSQEGRVVAPNGSVRTIDKGSGNGVVNPSAPSGRQSTSSQVQRLATPEGAPTPPASVPAIPGATTPVVPTPSLAGYRPPVPPSSPSSLGHGPPVPAPTRTPGGVGHTGGFGPSTTGATPTPNRAGGKSGSPNPSTTHPKAGPSTSSSTTSSTSSTPTSSTSSTTTSSTSSTTTTTTTQAPPPPPSAPTAKVPDVTGQPVLTACATLKNSTGQFNCQYSNGSAQAVAPARQQAGVVTHQSPSGRTKAATGTTVTITFYGMQTIPKVNGNVGTYCATLTATAGLACSKSDLGPAPAGYSGTAASDGTATVVNVSPAAGSNVSVLSGSATVTVGYYSSYGSVAVPQCTQNPCPRTAGITWNYQHVNTPNPDNCGAVMGQSNAAGSSVPYGTTVTVNLEQVCAGHLSEWWENGDHIYYETMGTGPPDSNPNWQVKPYAGWAYPVVSGGCTGSKNGTIPLYQYTTQANGLTHYFFKTDQTGQSVPAGYTQDGAIACVFPPSDSGSGYTPVYDHLIPNSNPNDYSWELQPNATGPSPVVWVQPSLG